MSSSRGTHESVTDDCGCFPDRMSRSALSAAARRRSATLAGDAKRCSRAAGGRFAVAGQRSDSRRADQRRRLEQSRSACRGSTRSRGTGTPRNHGVARQTADCRQCQRVRDGAEQRSGPVQFAPLEHFVRRSARSDVRRWLRRKLGARSVRRYSTRHRGCRRSSSIDGRRATRCADHADRRGGAELRRAARSAAPARRPRCAYPDVSPVPRYGSCPTVGRTDK